MIIIDNNKKLTIGELAKYLNVSVRTLQYYDQIGLMKPSELTESGRRIYLNKDITTLHQIITLKSLGFSLDDIKNKLISINDTSDVIDLLDNQSNIITNEIDKMEKVLKSIQLLKDEIKEKKEVDWYKYLNMMKLIKENNKYYWVIKHLDNQLMNHISEQKEIHKDISIGWWKGIFDRAISLQEKEVSPKSKEAQELANDWWNEMKKYSNGNLLLLNKMIDFYNSADKWPKEFREIQKEVQPFIEEAFLYYIEKNKIEIPKGEE